ncbi:porin family protein [candidate division KSB1 bacterium]|nr:porin family protein [candidate division KSB1 bacterium]
MKPFVMMLLGISLIAAPVLAQSNLVVSAFTGYSMSAFEDQESAAGTLPLGITVGHPVNSSLEVGGELNYALGGYNFESNVSGGKLTTTFNQLVVGAFGKYHFQNSSKYAPYAKAGLGFFTGDAQMEFEYNGQKQKSDSNIDSGVGFSLGAGIKVNKNVFTEFNYNIVSRKPDGGNSFGMNTWGILVGWTFGQ